VAGLLAGFVLLLFYPLLFTNRVLASGDILHYFYPYRAYASESLRAGRIPLWNPYIFAGVPFLANPQAAVLYPLHWPLMWLSPTKQIFWSGALHTWLLGMGGYMLMRRWGLGWLAGTATGLVLAGSGFFGGLLGHINQMNAAAWLPWMLWTLAHALETLRREGPGRGTAPGQAWTGEEAPDARPAKENPGPARRMASPLLLFGGLVALQLLAGHAQTVYINLFGVGCWLLWTVGHRVARGAPALPFRPRYPLALRGLAQGLSTGLRRTGGPLLFPSLVYVLGTLLGGWLAAAQIVPTLELSRLGLRSGGLSYRDASSFSLRPDRLLWTLLPSYGWRDLSAVFDTPGYTEYVAYVGALGLILALWSLGRGRDPRNRSPVWWSGVLLAGLGLFLALGRWNPFYYLLYQFVPGFDLFRAPARWMMLYTLGMAILAGLAVDGWERSLPRARSSPWARLLPGGLLALLAVDLLLAARALPHTRPTAPQAVFDVRTAPAYLLTDPARELHPGAMPRFLSMSTLLFDPGDMADWERLFRKPSPPPLDEAAFRELIVALKAQEILAPNLSLLWRIPALDGFDGGVLPLQRYIRFLGLFVPPEELVPDGRLREQVDRMPPADLLALAGVGYVITDKVQDLWFQGIYYDRQIGVHLSQDTTVTARVAVDRPFQATHVGLIAYVDGPPEALVRLEQGNRPVLRVAVPPPCPGPCPAWTLTAGGRPGAHLADGALDSPLAAAGGATVAYRDVEGGRQEYQVLLPLAPPQAPSALELTYLPSLPELSVVVRGMTLVDARTGTFQPLLPSDRGRFRRVHSGDVKIYAVEEGRGRAWFTSCVLAVSSPEEALDRLADPRVRRRYAVVEGNLAEPLPCTEERRSSRVTVQAYQAEQVVLRVETDRPGFLVLADAYYPGWEARVDGIPAPILPTNLLFRGVQVPPGEHRVVFTYRPRSWRLGLALSGLGWTLWGLGWVGLWSCCRRAEPQAPSPLPGRGPSPSHL